MRVDIGLVGRGWLSSNITTISLALYNHGIVYPDITGYNFIESQGKIWIIDFEHAYTVDPFVIQFIRERGETWNPQLA